MATANPPPRYVLCRPQGGFNDMLSQIELCCRYAEQTRRIVIVDTAYEGAAYFNDDLRKYFESRQSRQSRLVLGIDEGDFDFDAMTTGPQFLQGRVNTYRVQRKPDAGKPAGKNGLQHSWQDTETGGVVSFDTTKDSPEQLLVHHADGGLSVSMMALLRLRLTREITDELSRRLRDVTRGYDAVHVRHTDLRSDYTPLLEAFAKGPERRLFVATDNTSVLTAFREALGERVFSFSWLPDNEAPLHRMQLAPEKRFMRNRDAICDLLMLAMARRLNVASLKTREGQSGYSALAMSLFQSKSMLTHILEGSGIRVGLD